MPVNLCFNRITLITEWQIDLTEVKIQTGYLLGGYCNYLSKKLSKMGVDQGGDG